MNWFVRYTTGFFLNMTLLILTMTLFVLYMTGFVLNMTGFVLKCDCILHNMTGFVLYMTGFVVNMIGLFLNTVSLVLNMAGFVLTNSGFFLHLTWFVLKMIGFVLNLVGLVPNMTLSKIWLDFCYLSFVLCICSTYGEICPKYQPNIYFFNFILNIWLHERGLCKRWQSLAKEGGGVQTLPYLSDIVCEQSLIHNAQAGKKWLGK